MNTIVVTGVSRGMGRATAQRFLDEGWTVLGLGRTTGDLLTGAGRFVYGQADVRDREILDGVIGEFTREHGGIDVVANVAGVFPPSTLETYTEETYRVIFDTNVLGILNVTASAVPYMREGGAIVNFASVDAFTVSPGQLLYGASKAAVVMLTKELALELAPRRIRVNGIAPGWVNTPGNSATGRMAAAAASIPLGRVAEPEEIAQWVYLLADGQVAGFMDGETVALSGGDVMR